MVRRYNQTTEVTISVDIDLDELVSQIVYNQTESFETIKAIELRVADWGFTEEVFNYFLNTMLIGSDDEEIKESVNKTLEQYGYVRKVG